MHYHHHTNQRYWSLGLPSSIARKSALVLGTEEEVEGGAVAASGCAGVEEEDSDPVSNRFRACVLGVALHSQGATNENEIQSLRITIYNYVLASVTARGMKAIFGLAAGADVDVVVDSVAVAVCGGPAARPLAIISTCTACRC